jgi:hypothetical protein
MNVLLSLPVECSPKSAVELYHCVYIDFNAMYEYIVQRPAPPRPKNTQKLEDEHEGAAHHWPDTWHR